MPSVNERYFKEKFQNQKITQRRVAKTLNLNPSAITLILKGDRKLTAEEAVKMARLLNSPLDEILAAAGISTTATRASGAELTVSGWIDAAGIIHREPPKGVKTAPMPEFGGKGVAVLRYQTAGTALESLDGALVYYSGRAGIVASDVVGRMCVVMVAGGTKGETSRLAVVKRAYGGGPGVFNLADMSGQIVVEGVQLKEAAPVIWMKL